MKEALRVAIRTCTKIDYNAAKIVRIKDTLSLNEFEVSENMIPDLLSIDGIEILGEPYEMQFDDHGYLNDFE